MAEKGHTELLPCPFCGKPPAETYQSGIFCVTEDCPIDGVHCMDSAQWNTRAAVNTVEGLVKALEPFAKLADKHDELRRSGDCQRWIDFLIDFHWPSEGQCVSARSALSRFRSLQNGGANG